jgi:Tryptophan halogenase
VLGPDPRAPRLDSLSPARRLATNHFGGYGFWWWVIPLGGGETSIGLVYDSRHFNPGLDAGAREAYRRLVTTLPGLRDLVAGARMEEDDFHLRRRLAYTVERYADRGWALVGDAASFMDPYYSPGLDHGSMSVYATARLIEDDLRGRLDEAALGRRLARHNDEFARSYERWLNAVYTDKYELMGDAELVRIAFLVDTSLYYLGVINLITRDLELMAHPPFGLAVRQAAIVAAGMALLKRRLVSLARFRRHAGLYGRRNCGWRARGPAFGPGGRSVLLLLRGLTAWIELEAEYAWHRLVRGAVDVSSPVSEPSAPASLLRRET